MGTYSFYLTTRNNASGCKIDWESINKELIARCSVLERCYDDKVNSLQEVAERFIEYKLFGYLDYELKSALVEFCSHLIPFGSHPKIYFDYEGADWVYCLEFIPGTFTINIYVLDYSHLVSSETSHEEIRKIINSAPESSGWDLVGLV